MKDLKYFLDAEKQYQKNHKDGLELDYDTESGFMTCKSYPDDFLQEGWMHKYAQGPYPKQVTDAVKQYNLSDVEVLIMLCFYGNLSKYFRDDAYIVFGEVPKVAIEMQKVLESFIKKAPKHKDGKLYRFLKSHDIVDFKVGDVFESSCYLTTTNEDWEQDKDVYEITPLPEESTSAYDIYMIYNYHEENQVNFLKGTKFKVTNIEKSLNGQRRIYLDELYENKNNENGSNHF